MLWQRTLEEQFVPRLPPSRNDLLVLVSRTTKRKLHHYGIEFEHLLYQSTALAPLRSQFARAKHYRTTPSDTWAAKDDDIKAGRVQIKYHPGDLSRIWVLDPFSDQYIEVEAVDTQYTRDLSLWKHHVIQRYIQQELGCQVDQEALLLAKARLQQLITDEMRLTRKIRSRQTMARWWNEQVTTWINQSAQTASGSSGNLSTKTPTASPLQAIPAGVREAPSLEQAPMAQESQSPPSSVADLTAPLPPLQEQVVLLPEGQAAENTLPFSAFPPLPAEDHSSLIRKRRTRSHPTARAAEPFTPQRAEPQGEPSLSWKCQN